MSDLSASNAVGQRGPADHSIRDQIIDAAHAHFGHYGYGKTTVADLAKAIGFSKAYIYKFFDRNRPSARQSAANASRRSLHR
jgi:AraC-like DNA-binding protein